MLKLDVNINRQMTINTGNYSSIRPSVSITLKDVDASNFDKAYDEMDVICDSLLMMEIENLSELQDEFKAHGLSDVIENLNKEQMRVDTKIAIEGLKSL